MTYEELRAKWRDIKARPEGDPERQQIQEAMFYQCHLAIRQMERGEAFTRQRDKPEASKWGRGGYKRQ